MIKRILALAAVLSVLLAPAAAFSDAKVKGCDGPAELCGQVVDLNEKLAELKAVQAKELDAKVAAAQKEKEKKQEEDGMKVIAFAAVLAVALKGLISSLKSWKGYFKGVKGKAWLKTITLVVGFAAFIATNIGMGIPWWQALIVAGGGPGAMLVHDLADLVPVLTGKKKDLPPSQPPPASA